MTRPAVAGGALALAAALAALLATTACAVSDRGALDDVGPTLGFDGGPGSFVDAATSDGPLAPPAETEAPADTSDDRGYALACLDGLDADREGGADCADPECAAAPSCCVGATTTPCCTGAGVAYTLALSSCADPSSCGASAEVIGAPTLALGLVATVEAGGPSDAGLLVREPVDLRSGHVTIEAAVVAAGVPGASVDAVAVGLFAADAGGARSLPVAGLLVSASGGEVGIVAGDVVVASQPLAPSAAAQTFVMAVAPSGLVRVTGPGLDLSASVEVPAAPLRVGVIGRSEAGLASPVRVESVAVRRDACDVPAALAPRALTLDDRTGLFDPSTVAGPSLVRAPAEVLLAFAAERRSDGKRAIFVGVEDAARPGTFVVEATAARPQPVLASSTFLEEVSDPALAWDAAGGRFVLFATGIANGLRTIVRASSADASLVFGEPTRLEAPDDDFVSGMAPERDAPAIVPGDPSVILARETTPEGTAIVLLDVSAGAFAGRAGGLCDVAEACADPAARASDTVVTPRAGTLAIDADEVAAPSVAYHRGVYRLYYAGRRGLRWSIGVVVSADARYWRRPAAGDVVLGPTGSGAGALGALDPDVTITPDGELSLAYTAWNGVDTTIALATQTIRR